MPCGLRLCGRVHPFADKDAVFDADGAASGFVDALPTIAQIGLSPAMRRQVWPMLLGIFSPNHTLAERHAFWKRKRVEYWTLHVAQESDVDEEVAYRAAGGMEEWSVTSRRIALDAVRTEPTADFYVGRPGNVERLKRILHAYAKSDPGIGYCQGMADLASAFLQMALVGAEDAPAIFDITAAAAAAAAAAAGGGEGERSAADADQGALPSTDSRTRTGSGTSVPGTRTRPAPSTSGAMEAEADAFQLFWVFMQKRAADNFRISGAGMIRQYNQLDELLKEIDPELHAHMEASCLSNHVYAFRSLLLLFRRELPHPQCLQFWEMLWAAEHLEGSRLHLHCIVGVLQQQRKTLMTRATSLEDLLMIFNELPDRLTGRALVTGARAVRRRERELMMRRQEGPGDVMIEALRVSQEANASATPRKAFVRDLAHLETITPTTPTRSPPRRSFDFGFSSPMRSTSDQKGASGKTPRSREGSASSIPSGGE